MSARAWSRILSARAVGRRGFGCLLSAVFLLVLSATALAGPIGRVSASSGAVYYVSSSGSDTNPGTIAKPWRTIQHAANTLVAGDTVYIRAGTYHELVVPANSGSSGHVITYAAYPGEIVTIDGTGAKVPQFQGLFSLVGRSYIRVSGLRVINSNYYGIVADTSTYITIDKNYTHNTYSSGISTWNCSHVIVDHNEVAGACYGPLQESLSISNTNTFEVRYNLVHDVMPGTTGKEGITIKDASAHGKVYGNQVYNLNLAGLYVDAEAGHLYDVEVYQNLVHDIKSDAGNGFDLGSEGGGLLEDIRLYNNISYNNLVGLWLSGYSIPPTHPFKDITIINNTFAYNGRGTWGGGISIENLQIQNVIIRNNICSQNIYSQIYADPSVRSALAIDHNLTDGDRGDHEVYGATDLIGVSPQFVDPSGRNFHVRATSPAIDAGSSLGAPAFDFDNRARPYDGNFDGTPSYDIGACEYQGPVPVVTVLNPTSGPTSGGTSVTITGTGFTRATAVKVGTTAATGFTVNSSTKITAKAPAHAAGVVDVRVTTPGGTSAVVTADRYTYFTRYEETDPKLVLQGSWGSYASSAYSGGTLKLTNSGGAAANVSFTGTGISWIATKAANYGIARVFLDYGAPVLVDLYSSRTKHQQKVWTVSGLPSGPHTVRIEWTGTKNPSATNSYVTLDAVDVVGTLTQAPTRYEEKSALLYYSVPWTGVSSSSCSGGV